MRKYFIYLFYYEKAKRSKGIYALIKRLKVTTLGKMQISTETGPGKGTIRPVIFSSEKVPNPLLVIKGIHTKKVIKFPSSTESIGRPIFCFRMNKIVAANPNPAIKAAIFPQNSVKDNSSKKKSPRPNSIMKIVIQSTVLDFSPRNEKLKIAT